MKKNTKPKLKSSLPLLLCHFRNQTVKTRHQTQETSNESEMKICLIALKCIFTDQACFYFNNWLLKLLSLFIMAIDLWCGDRNPPVL